MCKKLILKANDLKSTQKKFDKQTFDLKKTKSSIRKYLQDLKKCKRPVFLIGGGAQLSNCSSKVLEIAKALNVPCVPTWNGIDTVTSDFELYGGRVGTYGGTRKKLWNTKL